MKKFEIMLINERFPRLCEGDYYKYNEYEMIEVIRKDYGEDGEISNHTVVASFQRCLVKGIITHEIEYVKYDVKTNDILVNNKYIRVPDDTGYILVSVDMNGTKYERYCFVGGEMISNVPMIRIAQEMLDNITRNINNDATLKLFEMSDDKDEEEVEE